MSRRTRGESGSVSLLVVIMVPALLIAAGLVLDGGRQLEARREARGAAQAAAHAAVQQSGDELLGAGIDLDAAIGRAEAALAAQGAVGSVAVVGGAVVVTVSRAVDFLVLPGGVTVTEQASAAAVVGVEGGVG